MSHPIDHRVSRARAFRQNPTDVERLLWQRLRNLPLGAVHFRRQATIEPYFADFACHSHRLVIELDGGQHADSASDEVRTAYLTAAGYRVIRFWNNEVLENIEGVLETIVSVLAGDLVRQSPPTPAPSPPQGRGEGS